MKPTNFHETATGGPPPSSSRPAAAPTVRGDFLPPALATRYGEAVARRALEKRSVIVDRSLMPARPSYGFVRVVGEPGRIRVDETAARHVVRAFQMAALGAAPARIAVILDEAGALTAYGGRWTAPKVRALLRNPLYRGALVAGRPSRRTDRRAGEGPAPAVRRPRTVENPHLLVVPPVLWWGAQPDRNR